MSIVRPIIIDKPKNKSKLPIEIPQLHFAMTALASRGSGKTAIICGIIKDFYRKTFEDIIVISPTVFHDLTFKSLEKYDNISFRNKCSDNILFTLLEIQKIRFQQDKSKTLLLYLDDMASKLRSQNKQGMDELFSTCRHYGISLIICAQHYSHLSPTVRDNTDSFLVWRLGEKEYKKMAEDGFRFDKTEEEFVQYCLENTREPHSFVYLNGQNNQNGRFNIGFS